MQRRAGKRAAERGLSLAEYMRRLVARDLDQSHRSADPSVVFALGNSGKTDIAGEKDRLLGEATAARNAYGGKS